jgi:MipA family protein
MWAIRLGVLLGAAGLGAAGAWAQDEALPDRDERPPSTSPDTPPGTDAPPPRRWAAAVGLVASVGPEFAGSSRVGVNVQPGFALRWGRVSLASRSAFAVRGGDPGARGGLRVELVRSERWRSSLGLRWDSGRDEGDSVDLRGLGDVRGTLRARLSLSYRMDDGWRVAGAVATDALGRGGGWLGDVSVGRDWRLSPATGLGGSLAVGFAGSRWQQNYFGITPEQSLRTGYAVYTPGSGLREAVLSLGGRTELTPRWAVFYGSSISRLLGPPLDSPLVRQRSGWGLSAGVVMRI